MDGYNHYIRVNEAGIIIHGYSSAFEQPEEGDILILEDGPRHFHEAFPEPLVNERGQYLYRWSGTKMIERSTADLYAEWEARPPSPPTAGERIAELEAAQQQNKLEQAQANTELFEMMLMLSGGGM